MRIDRFVIGVLGLWQSGRALKSAFEEEDPPPKHIAGRPVIDLPARKAKRTMHQLPPLSGRASVESRAKLLRDLVRKGKTDPNVRAFALKIVNQRCGPTWCIRPKDWKHEIEVVFRTLRDRYYRYAQDPNGVDTFQSAARTLEWGGGDCDDAAVLLASVLGSIGYETRGVVVELRSGGWHIYVEAKIPDPKGPRWIPLDLTMPHPPGWAPPASLVKRTFRFPL